MLAQLFLAVVAPRATPAVRLVNARTVQAAAQQGARNVVLRAVVDEIGLHAGQHGAPQPPVLIRRNTSREARIETKCLLAATSDGFRAEPSGFEPRDEEKGA